MNCIDIKSKAFQRLVEESGLSPLLVEIRTAAFQSKNGLESWPTIEDIQGPAEIIEEQIVPSPQPSLDNELESMYNEKVAEINKELADAIGRNDRAMTAISEDQFKSIKRKYDKNVNSNITIDRVGTENTDSGKKIIYTFKLKDNVSQVAYDRAVKTLNEIKSAPFTAEERQNMISKVTPIVDKNDQTEIGFGSTLKMSQIGIKNPMANSTINVVTGIANKFNARFGMGFKILPYDQVVAAFNEGVTENHKITGKNGLLGFFNAKENTAYLIDSELSAETTIHEMFGHPFLNMLKNNPELKYIYNQLALEAARHQKDVFGSLVSYKDYSDSDKLDELIIKALEDKSAEKIMTPGLKGTIREYWKAFTDFIKDVFGKRNDIEQLRPNTTLDRLSNWILYGEDKLSLIDGYQRTLIADDVNKVLDLLDPKKLRDFEQRTITLSEAIKFSNDVAGELSRQNIIDNGVYDTEFIRKNILSKLSYVDFAERSVEYASGNTAAIYDVYDNGNSLMIKDIEIKDKTKRVDTAFILKSLVANLDRSSFNEVLIAIGKNDTLYNQLLTAFKDDAIYEREIDGERYFVLSPIQDEISNKASFGRKSRLKKAAALISTPQQGQKESSLPTDIEMSSSSANNFLHTAINGLTANIKILERRKSPDQATIEEMKNLLRSLKSNEIASSALSFVEFAYRDVLKSAKSVNEMKNIMTRGDEISPDDINYIRRDFHPLYDSTMHAINTILNLKNYGPLVSLPMSKIKEIQHQYTEIQRILTDIDKTTNLLVNYEWSKMAAKVADEVGSPTMKELLKNFSVAPSDLHALGVFFGSLQNKKDERLRVLDKTVVDIQSKITREIEIDGVLGGLADSFAELSKFNPTVTYKRFMEHNKDGKATGYMLSDLLRGQFNKDVEDFRKYLQKKYDLKSKYDVPSDPSELKTYNDELDDYLSENAERMFTREYYDAKKSLSSDASEVLNNAKETLSSFVLGFRNEQGFIDTRLMTQADISKFRALKQAKANLSSKVYMDGTEKMAGSIDRIIADEISEFYKKINKGLTYSLKNQLFEETYKNVLSSMSQEEADTWFKNNTKVAYKQKWWDKLTSIEKNPQLPIYDELYELRKSLLNIYRNPDTMEIPAYILENTTIKGGSTLADKIKKIDIALSTARLQHPPKNGLGFKDIAKIEPTDEYKKTLRAVAQESLTNPSSISDFDNRTTYIDANGYRQLYSYWTKLIPKDENMIYNEPNTLWSEVDQSSEFINKNFNIEESEGGMVPKRSKYDNSREYNKLMKDSRSKAFYDKLKDAYEVANSNYSYIQNPSKYRLAQIPGTFLERITKGDTFLSGFREAMADQVRWMPYDNIDGDYDTAGLHRADGSKVRFVPTKYRTMLEDRDSISRDLLGSFAEYYRAAVHFREMSENAEKIELMLDGIKQTRVVDKENREVKGAGQSNTYSRASHFVSSAVYSDQLANDYSIKLGKKGITTTGATRERGNKFSLAKPMHTIINDFVRKINLFLNLFAIQSNAVASQINLKVEASCGIWMNNNGYLKGQKEVIASLPSALTKNLSGYSHNKLLSMMRMFGVTKSNLEDMKDLHGATLLKNVSKVIGYGPFTAGDFATKGAMLVGVLSNFKPYNGQFYSREQFISEFFPGNRSNGEIVFDAIDENMYDAFEVRDNMLRVNPKYASSLSESSINYATTVAADLARKLDGTLTAADKGKLHADAFASAFFLHRGFMQVAAEERFSSRKFNYRKQAWSSGDYTNIGSSGKILLDYLAEKVGESMHFKFGNTLGFKMGDMKNKYSTDQLYNFRKISGDLKWLMLVSVAAVLAGSMVGDSDDDKKRSWQQFIYTILLRNVLELGSVRSPMDAYGLIQSPTAAQPAIQQLGEIFGGMLDGTLFDRIQEGRYQYYTKLERALIKLTPAYKNYFETFIKPDLKAREAFSKKNINVIFTNVEKIAMTPAQRAKKDAIQKLEQERFNKQMEIDRGENKYLPLGYEETPQDLKDQKIRARRKSRSTRKINRQLKKVKKTM
jgi:hypothetical protein